MQNDKLSKHKKIYSRYPLETEYPQDVRIIYYLSKDQQSNRIILLMGKATFCGYSGISQGTQSIRVYDMLHMENK